MSSPRMLEGQVREGSLQVLASSPADYLIYSAIPSQKAFLYLTGQAVRALSRACYTVSAARPKWLVSCQARQNQAHSIIKRWHQSMRRLLPNIAEESRASWHVFLLVVSPSVPEIVWIVMQVYMGPEASTSGECICSKRDP